MKLKNRLITALLLSAFAAVSGEREKKEEPPLPPEPPVPYLSPEEQLKTFQLPAGYKLEPALTDPDIREPVVCVFDGNGRMYIAEMRSYMQEIDGKNQHTPVGVVSMHESTKWDGKFDKHSIFADKLVLPRMVLPLDDRVLINVTDTNDIFMYQDTNGDGVSDKKDNFYQGGPRGGNLEHQPSGLIWGMDNWLYTAGNDYRLRFANGTAAREKIPSNGGQWGLAQDDHGKPWFSNGGGEISFFHFQTHIQYAAIDLPDQKEKGFMEVWPLVPIPDVQGGKGRFRPIEKTLNHFTASCGQEVFRGDRLPPELRGDAFIGEPVGRLIRRAKVEVRDGVTYLSNPYQGEKSEFIRSTDPNFRTVNMTTGPDGCLYIVDMYRGIIQEGNWVREGSYLRRVVKQYSLQNNAGRGRIWRLTHKDFKPGPQPRMLSEKSIELVAHLEHPNGWWRDTAQKLIVLRGDKTVIPQLKELVRNSKNYLARMHALWTLEGLGEIEKNLIREKFKDSNPPVRAAAIRVAESLFRNKDTELINDVLALVKDSDPGVTLQALMTARYMKWQDAEKLIETTIASSSSRGVKEIGKILIKPPDKGGAPQYTDAEKKILAAGEAIFKELCFSCHGNDGKGMQIQGAAPGLTMAPPLGGSKTLMASRYSGIYVLLNGLTGPTNGKNYDAQMVPMNTNTDEWIASAVSYVRNSFGNRGSFVTPADVARIRPLVKGRTTQWTVEELKAMLPEALTNSKSWKLSASHGSDKLQNAIDKKMESRWDTGASQVAGMWFQVELPEEIELAAIHLDAGASKADYPRGYKAELSTDGKTWSKPVAEGKGNGVFTDIEFAPQKAKFIRITQTGSVNGLFWSIHEIQVFKAGKAPQPANAEKK